MRQGFGSRLIENALRCESGKGCFEFTPEGLVCSLSIPSASVKIDFLWVFRCVPAMDDCAPVQHVNVHLAFLYEGKD